LIRFKLRMPDIAGIRTRQIDAVRFKATNRKSVKRLFDTALELWVEHQYISSHLYSMDESGYAVGHSQSSRALLNVRDPSSWEQIASRPEWITAIECLSASETAVPPLLISKAKHTETGRIPAKAPPDWRFSTSHQHK
jgi:hypothetical protein